MLSQRYGETKHIIIPAMSMSVEAAPQGSNCSITGTQGALGLGQDSR